MGRIPEELLKLKTVQKVVEKITSNNLMDCSFTSFTSNRIFCVLKYIGVLMDNHAPLVYYT